MVWAWGLPHIDMGHTVCWHDYYGKAESNKVYIMQTKTAYHLITIFVTTAA